MSGECLIGPGELGGGICSTVLKDSFESSEPDGFSSEGKSSSSFEVGKDLLSVDCHPEDRPLGDPPGPGFPEWVGLGVGGWEHYPCRECFPDIGPELAGFDLPGPRLAG